MDWNRVSVKTTEQAHEIVSELLLRCGAKGTEIQGGAQPYIAEQDWAGEAEPEGDCWVSAYFAKNGDVDITEQINDEIEKLTYLKLGIDLGTLEMKSEPVREKDWESAWKAYFKPTKVSDYVVVKPTWEEYEKLSDDEIVIEIDPGMAFGTGAHETTRMCISLLEEFLEEGHKVLDIGCGSGILSVAAAKLGAKSIVATDIDGVAIKVAKENAKVNGIDSITFIEGDIMDGLSDGKTFNCVVANIIADVIIELNTIVSDYIKKPGIYIISGIIAERLDEVLMSLHKNDFRLIKIKEDGEWRAIACKNKI